MDSESSGRRHPECPLSRIEVLRQKSKEFLLLLAVASSPSPAERAAFMAFALQRVRAASLKGTCAIILARPVSRTAPGGVHRRGALPLIQPKPRPRVQPSYPHPRALSHGLPGLVLSQTPRRLGPRSRCLLLCPPTHTERPRCLASAATALLFLVPPHM